MGDAVFGQAAGCLGSAVLTCGHTLVPMPRTVTFTEASTIPTVFLTAYSCLHDEAGISQSSQLLIHAATGEILTCLLYMMHLFHRKPCLPGDSNTTLATSMSAAGVSLNDMHARDISCFLPGGLGLAAVQIARAAGARVLATAGSMEKREHLRKQGVRDVLSSRDLQFADHLGRKREDRPSTVLNSLTSPGVPYHWG